MTDDISSIAYHEAGHAVIAVILGGEVLSLTLEPDDVETLPERAGEVSIRWHHRGVSKRELIQREVITCLAGPAAEMIYRGEEVDPQSVAEWRYDWEIAWQLSGLLIKAPQPRTQILEGLLAELCRMLQRDACWQAIAETADQLEAHETLDGDEVHQIVARWIGEAT